MKGCEKQEQVLCMVEAASNQERDQANRISPCQEPDPREKFHDVAKAANAFSASVLDWLGDKDEGSQATWLRTCVEQSRDILKPWTLEILFIASVLGPCRFSELEDLLGISSRTLSDRLKLLADADLIDRTVHDEHPVRVEYSPTKHGRRSAALAAPLLAQLDEAWQNPSSTQEPGDG